MKPLFTLFICLWLLQNAMAQQSRLFFRKLTVADGLNNGNISAIGQDAKGFLWFASLNGLNRFDGYEVKSYSHIAGDSTALPASIVRSMSVDSSGRFLIGHETGLMEYDAGLDRFTRIPALENIWVDDIVAVDKNTVFLATFSGLVKYDPNTGKAIFYSQAKDARYGGRVFSLLLKNRQLYIGSSKGFFILDLQTEQLKQITTGPLANTRILSVAVDADNNTWLAGTGEARLLKLSPGFKDYTVYDQHVQEGSTTIVNFSDMKADRKGRIWIITRLDGLLLYNAASDRFEHFAHDPKKVWTPSTNLHSSILCDKDGMLWIGGNNGVNYAHPDKHLFSIIPAFDKYPDTLSRRVARVATEDKNGNLWLGTLDGVVKYDIQSNRYTEWNNRQDKTPVIHYNSIRGLLCDDENNIWIATGRGINKYDQSTGQMIFYTGKDSIPAAFYFSIDRDLYGNFWFGTRDYDGFYYYDPSKRKFFSIRTHPVLNKFTGLGGRKLLHDSKGRYWLGFNSDGVGMYDPLTRKIHHWKSSDRKQAGIAGNIIIDIVEDKKGIVWISSFNGLSAIDPETLHIQNYNHTNGLINSSAGPLAVDAWNRLWIGTGSGLMMLDSSRRYFTSFGLQHGLPSIEFPEHAAYTMRTGEIMMATQNGYIRFNPLSFSKETKQLTPFLTSFTVSGKKELPFNQSSFSLHHDENFFNVGFGAINYENATGTWYAYKLEGVDEDWKYTQNRFAEYTRIAGGNYIFRFKASADRDQWPGAEQQIHIHIDTVFFKTWWFYLLLLVFIVVLIYRIYRYRMQQQRQLMELQGKAQMLEKEKTLVMYESLKQQLNPHFLFNSLTSLSGLIETDQKMAGNFLDQMSKIYRYILKSRDSEVVPLSEEIDFVQVYINLQKTRFKNGLQVNINVGEDARYRKIVPVTLQNMVENAIKHNIIDPDAPLVIDIFTENGYLVVKNNLQKKHVVESSNRQGLASMHSLYSYLTSRQVIIEENEKYFVIKIPLI